MEYEDNCGECNLCDSIGDDYSFSDDVMDTIQRGVTYIVSKKGFDGLARGLLEHCMADDVGKLIAFINEMCLEADNNFVDMSEEEDTTGGSSGANNNEVN